MKTFIAFFFVAFFANASLAQDQIQTHSLDAPAQGWYQQYSGSSQSINTLTFVNKDTGWAGSVYTTNGGITWTADQTGRYIWQFIDDIHGWSTSPNGTNWISRTSDGGHTWVDYNTEIGAVSNLFFCTPSRGFFSNGNHIAFTIDSGKSWKEDTTNVGQIAGFACFDSLHTIAGGKNYLNPDPPHNLIGGIFYTSNGGASWKLSTAVRTVAIDVPFAAFDTATVYFFGGASPRAYKSINYGYSLQPFNLPNGGFAGSDIPQAGCATDRNNITIVGTSGIIFRSYDGITWEKQNSGTTADLYAVTFVDSTTGWAAGANELILHTTNAGKSWVRQNIPIPLEVEISPQPFSTKTTARYSLPSPVHVSIGIYDVNGKVVERLIENQFQESGTHSVEIDGSNMRQSTYYLRLDAGTMTGFAIMTRIVP